jgi:hypothetical protein
MTQFGQILVAAMGDKVVFCNVTNIAFVETFTPQEKRELFSIPEISAAVKALNAKARKLRAAANRRVKAAKQAARQAAKKTARKLGSVIRKQEVKGAIRTLRAIKPIVEEAVQEHGREVGRYLALLVAKHGKLKQLRVQTWNWYLDLR